MSTRDPVWRQRYARLAKSLRLAAGSARRQPWYLVGGAAAVLIAIITIASQGRATPSAPVPSLNGQVAWQRHHTRLPGNVPTDAPPIPRAQASPKAASAPSQPAVAKTGGNSEQPSTKPSAQAAAPPQSGRWPVTGKLLQGYGWTYQPIGGYWFYNTTWQIAAPAGTDVHAAFAGVVKDIEQDPTQGLTVIVQSAGGLTASYGGLQSASVAIGQQVAAGAAIGSLAPVAGGPKGTPELHFALRQGGQPVDPSTYIQAAGR